MGLGLVAVLGCLGAYWFTGIALRPLRRVSSIAGQIGANTLHTRLALEGPTDEIKGLADSFDAMLERLERTFEMQNRFVGALALGVIMSRAVVERRQHIGMLRALGFSRGLVLGAFLLEGGFIITLSVVIGTTLALWSAWKITSSLYPDFPIPVLPILLILLGSYVVTVLATILPASRAARILPAEALRYE